MLDDDKEQKRLIRKQRQKERIRQAEIDQAVKNLLATPNGRDYLWWLLQIGRVNTQPFAPNALNTAFNCGELNVGNQILAHIISVDPAGYVRMQQEKADAERSDADRTNAADADLFGDADDE